MNPFDLRGPEFLVFYAVLATLLIVVSRVLLRRQEERVEGPAVRAVRDPYLIAALRGGRDELLRVAVLALAGRGLLTVTGEGRAQATEAGLAAAPAGDVERELLAYCREPRTAAALFRGPALRDAAQRYEDELVRLGFLLDRPARVRRRNFILAGWALLAMVTAIRVAAAFTTGHTHIEMLLVLTGVAVVAVAVALLARRTAAGNAYVREMRNLFRSLSLRPRDLRGGNARSELAMIAAVFGTATLSFREFAWAHRFFSRGHGAGAVYAAGAAGGGACDGGAACGCGAAAGCGAGA